MSQGLDVKESHTLLELIEKAKPKEVADAIRTIAEDRKSGLIIMSLDHIIDSERGYTIRMEVLFDANETK